MISAEWLFQNHWDHIAMVKLLKLQLGTEATTFPMSDQERDEEIAAIVLSRPLFDGLPHNHDYRGSSTERAVLAMDQPEAIHQTIALQKQLAAFEFLLKIFDSLMSILDISEQQFILLYYGKRYSLVRITEVSDGPVYGFSKTTVWTYKNKLLAKCDSLLFRLCPPCS